MNNQKKRTLIRTTALLQVFVYVFIMVGYLFFAPIFQNRRISGNARIKVNTQLIYNLIRTNRCMANDNKQVKSAIKAHASLSVSKHTGFYKSVSLLATNKPALYFLIDQHFTYLSNRVLRI